MSFPAGDLQELTECCGDEVDLRPRETDLERRRNRPFADGIGHRTLAGPRPEGIPQERLQVENFNHLFDTTATQLTPETVYTGKEFKILLYGHQIVE